MLVDEEEATSLHVDNDGTAMMVSRVIASIMAGGVSMVKGCETKAVTVRGFEDKFHVVGQ